MDCQNNSQNDAPVKMNICFNNKKVLVTGAGKGIGRSLVSNLAAAGANVVAVSRTESDLVDLKNNSEFSERIEIRCIDLSNWEEAKVAVKAIGPVDYLINNAGLTDPELFKEFGTITEEEIDRIFNINVKAIINVTQLIAQTMKPGAAIVNISCIIGERGAPKSSVYCASKAAVNQLTRAMAVEYGRLKIRVNAVNPTTVRTIMTEDRKMFDSKNVIASGLVTRTALKRFAEVDDIVGPVFFLLSSDASMVTGVCLPVDGGLSVSFL